MVEFLWIDARTTYFESLKLEDGFLRMMNGNILILFVSLNAIQFSKQMPANTVQIERFLGALSGATNSILRGVEECFEQYLSDSILEGEGYAGNEEQAESENTKSYGLFESCIRLSIQMGKMKNEQFLNEKRQRKSSMGATIQAVAPESLDTEDDDAPAEKQKNHFVERLLMKLRALKQLISTKVASGRKSRFGQQKGAGKIALRMNGNKRGPPFPVGRFGK